MNKEIEKDFCCPISNQIFYDPVILSDGITYERECIEHWLKTKNMSPVTQKIVNKSVTPNYSLKSIIDVYLKDNIKLKENQYAPQIISENNPNSNSNPNPNPNPNSNPNLNSNNGHSDYSDYSNNFFFNMINVAIGNNPYKHNYNNEIEIDKVVHIQKKGSKKGSKKVVKKVSKKGSKKKSKKKSKKGSKKCSKKYSKKGSKKKNSKKMKIIY